MKLAGKNPVFEKLRVDPKSIIKIYMQSGFSDAGYVHQRAAKHGIPVLAMSAQQMDRIGRGKNTQGIMADVSDFAYVPYDDLLEQAVKKKRTLVFLDGVTDPQNPGAILRSLGALGRFSLVLPTHDSASITETVMRVASGGENYVPVALVGNINKAIAEAKEENFTIVGTVTSEGTSVYEADLPAHVGLVIGGEEKGIRPVIQKNLDIKLTIPMLVSTMSLNVAQATTIFCYEIIRQKKAKKQPTGEPFDETAD